MGKHLGLSGCFVLAAVLLAACVRDARIAVPSDLAAVSERIELTGMGNGERGSFRLGASEGRFTRSSLQEGYDGGFLKRDFGGGSFEVAGPEVGGTLSGRCEHERTERNVGALVVPDQRFAYRCGFERDGRPIEAGLILEAVPSRPDKLLSGITRAGEIHLGGHVLGIRPIHEMEGGRLPTGMPLGYAFDLDGRSVGAVDLNGADKTIYVPPSEPARETVIAASIALSILWDPGE